MALTTILEYVLYLVWTLLTLTAAKMQNPAFATVLSAQDVVERLLSEVRITFAPGLMDAVRAATPPTIAYFKSLPYRYEKIWAVYLLVLEKADSRPMIYVGSATTASNGFITRANTYKNLSYAMLPSGVIRALRDGYTIVHIGLLCWAPIPTPAKIYAVRALFLAIEAVFAIVFWALRSRTTTYGSKFNRSLLSFAVVDR